MRSLQAFHTAAHDISARRKIDAFTVDKKGTRFREDAVNIALTPEQDYRVTISVSDISDEINEWVYKALFPVLKLRPSVDEQNFLNIPISQKIIIKTLKNKTRLKAGEYRPTLAISFTIDSISGEIRDPDVFLARTLLKQIYDFEGASELIVQAPEGDFFDLMTLAAESYFAKRPFLSVFDDQGGIAGHYMKGLIMAASHAMGMYAYEKNIPCIYAGQKVVISMDQGLSEEFAFVVRAAQSCGKNNIEDFRLDNGTVFKFLPTQYDLSPIQDIQTDTTTHVKFTSPFRQLAHFINFMQVASHVRGEDYFYNRPDLEQAVMRLNQMAHGPRYNRVVAQLGF